MSDYNYLSYKELKNLKKGERIMVRENHRTWQLGTFIGHTQSYGSAVMKFAFDYCKDENKSYQWTAVFTGLDYYKDSWNRLGCWREFRWPSEEELNTALLEKMTQGVL